MKALITAVAATALLAACGTAYQSSAPAGAPAGASTPTVAADGSLVGPDGRTLYQFARDTSGSGQSACVDTCAVNWPPLGVAASAMPLGDYTIITRADGRKQWAYKGLPLYYYIKDTKPGDKMGAGVGGVWKVARP